MMKRLWLSAGVLVLLASASSAESLGPEDVVRTLVRGAHENNLEWVVDNADLVKIASHPRHGRSPESLVEFLKGIAQDKITFQAIKREGWPKSTIVRMTAPISMDFDLELVKATEKKQEDRYVVVSVHP
jgi:hypothetical protein